MTAPLHVLILEDNASDAELMLAELEQAGYDPHWVRIDNEEEYLTHLNRQWDVILADYNLPTFNAPRALKLLQERKQDIPLIIVTGSISEEIAVDSIKKGASDYLLKDRMARLGPAVRRALQEKTLRDYKFQAEEALRQREEQLRLLLSSTAEAIYGVDLEGNFTFCNPACVKLLGYGDEKELLGKNMHDLVHHIRRDGIHCPGSECRIYEAARGAASHQGEDEILWRRDGSSFVAQYRSHPIRKDDRTVGSVVTFQDITERKAAETEIKRSHERLRALHEIDLAINSTLDLAMVLNVLLEKIDLVLPYAATVVRLYDDRTGDFERVAGHRIHDEEESKIEVRHGRGLAKEAIERRVPVIVRNARKDPRIANREFFLRRGFVSCIVAPLIAKENFLGLLSFYAQDEHEFTDDDLSFITTLAGQAAIAIHNSRLYEETKKQAAALQKANRVKTEFLSVMSHELRTPLNVIMGYTAMIFEKMLGEINAEQEETLRKILRHSSDFLSMITGVLNATQIESNEVEVQRSSVNLTSFLELLRRIYDTPFNKGLTLTWDYPSDLPPVNTDPEKVKQILDNLINNAIKFTDRGTITVSARYRPEEKILELRVADTGVGIEDEHLPIIFDIFRQVDSSETRLYGGVGLGLFIVRKFTELLGGTVDVQSEVGKGSTFTVRLPC